MKHKIEVDELGRITHSFTLFIDDPTPEVGIEVSEQIDIDKHYWDHNEKKVKPRRKKIHNINKREVLADGEDEIVLTDLVSPTTVQIGDEVRVITNGTFRFKPKELGKHKLHICDGLHLNDEIEIDAK